MRKIMTSLATSLLLCSTACAFWPEAADSSLELGVGYRNESYKAKTKFRSFDFIHETDSCVELENEFKIKDIKIWLIELKGKYLTCDNIYIRAKGDYGWFGHSKNTDSYCTTPITCDTTCNTDCTTCTTTHGDSHHGHHGDTNSHDRHRRVRGQVYDFDFALGYQFRMCDDSFAITPVIGLSAHAQRFKVHNKHHFTSDDSHHHHDNHISSSSSCSCSSSSSGDHHDGDRLRTHWIGPFLGVDFDYRLFCDWNLTFGYEFHWARFHADGPKYVSPFIDGKYRQHSRRAYGHVFNIGTNYDFCECWTIGLNGEFQFWNAKHAHTKIKTVDKKKLDVDNECFLIIPLDKVERDSYAVTIDIGMMF